MSASRLKQSTKRHNANISMAYGCTKDNNTYCYRMTNGHKHLHRIILGYGWENTPFDVTKLSCYEKGEGSMAHKTGPHENWLDWDKLMPQVRDLLATGKSIPRTADILGIKVDTLRKRLKKEMQSPPDSDKVVKKCGYCGREIKEDEPDVWQIAGSIATYCDKCYKKIRLPVSSPEICAGCEYKGQIYKGQCYADCPEQAQAEPGGDQPAPAQEAQEPANNSISENEITVKDVLLYELEQSEKGDVHSEPRDDYTVPRYEAPQRVNLTRAQYDAMAMNDDRMSALAIFCENQAVEQLRQDWAVDIFKHSRLSRERKLELIGRLLDWGQGA